MSSYYLNVASGSVIAHGSATLVAGVATIAAALVQATSVFIWGTGDTGALSTLVSFQNIVPGVSFQIVSNSVADVQTLYWAIVG